MPSDIIKALSVQQPYAWLLLHGKDHENRSWYSGHTGLILIHASAKLHPAHKEAAAFALRQFGITVPPADELELGGIVGVMRVAPMVNRAASIWYAGEWAWPVIESQVLPFTPCRGALGLWNFKRGDYERLLLKHACDEDFANRDEWMKHWQQ